MQARVFVVNETLRRSDNGQLERAQDLSPALAFGQLRHLLPAGQPPTDPAIMVDTIDRGLKDFTVDDFLLLVGHPAAIGIAVALAHRRTEGPVRILRWSARDRRYQEMLLPLPRIGVEFGDIHGGALLINDQ